MEWVLGGLSAVAALLVIITFVRSLLRDRASLRVSIQCLSVPGCETSIAMIRKVGMTPVQLLNLGFEWGRPKGAIRRRSRVVVVTYVVLPPQERGILSFDGETYSEWVPLGFFTDVVQERGRPDAFVVTTPGRRFSVPVPDEVWHGMLEVVAKREKGRTLPA